MRSRCPTCGKQGESSSTVDGAASETESDAAFRWRPFCSRRCKMIDLGNWLDEVYRFSRPLGPDDVRDEGALLGQLLTSAREE